MTILEELFKEVGANNLTEQVRAVCEKIYKEEQPTFKYPEVEPKGPNIFLAVEVPGKTNKQTGFLTLERESEEEYVAVFYLADSKKVVKGDRDNSVKPRRSKVWEINENKAERILTRFAKICKTLRGK